jgi:hypothetical protein
MPKPVSNYGRRYREARARLLAGNPPCWWCGKPATTADHVPSIKEAGRPHLNLVPACAPCNYGRRPLEERTYPGPSREW